ncbi:MAG: GreA/GreB family elongation factor [Planctomycetaceae bacterium]|nr:GreA/GreB family elongation factor [Planctomycetaceae bacterium]
MTHMRIEMTCFDHLRLNALADHATARDLLHFPDGKHIATLQEKLDMAQCWESADIPPDVVTMGSTVLVREIDNDEFWTFTLCYPKEANIIEGRVSVLSGIGTTLLGQRVGDVVDWPVPSGKVSIEVVEVVYQPEAAQRWEEPELVLT